MEQKHSALHIASKAGLLQGLPRLGVQRVQRKDGAKECPQGNIWSSQIPWAVGGLVRLRTVQALGWEASTSRPPDSIVEGESKGGRVVSGPT